ncbi:MAG: DMT family transporter [Oscillospiraceae bacterium]|nr:DMT family transporter [Oscillospiraceae bacterium]
MNILGLWYINLIIAWFCSVLRTQCFKVATKTAKDDGALTILLQLISGALILIWVPFFDIRFPTDPRVYFFVGLAVLFFALNNRLSTTIMRGIEASTFSILKQTNVIFMIIIGLTFFGEPAVPTAIIGAILIIFSNFLVFYKKGDLKMSKYVALGVLSNLSLALAVTLDIRISGYFNLPFYMMITFSAPALVIFLFERTKISTLKEEFKNVNKKILILIGLSWSVGAIAILRAYLLGNVTVVAPLSSISVMLNVLAGYIFLKERENLLKKIIAGVLIIISVFLIQM